MRVDGHEVLTPARVVAASDEPVGAYLHVPFCEWICPFCPYNKVRAEADLARRYFASLRTEVDAYAEAYAAGNRKLHSPARRPFTSLYVGGGTPTLYPDALADIVGRIPVAGERAIEVLPTHGTPNRLDRLAEIGFTAVSVGAQSFHDAVLRRLGRPHDAATSLAAVRNARERFGCVDVDLIIDVALDDIRGSRGGWREAFLADVRTCFASGVDQVSTYPLMRFGYTPFGKASHARRREHEVLDAVTDMALRMGYERRSVWTFNRSGSPSYTSITRRRFLGMGAGSSSYLGRDFFVNHFGVATYCRSVEAGRVPVARWMHLGRWGGAAYDGFWQAYAGAVDVPGLERSYGRGPAAVAEAVLAPLVAGGLVRREHDAYRLTPRGFDAYHDLERLVTYQLIEPLWGEMLQEHERERVSALPLGGEALGNCPLWATPERARSGVAWSATRLGYERKGFVAGPLS